VCASHVRLSAGGAGVPPSHHDDPPPSFASFDGPVLAMPPTATPPQRTLEATAAPQAAPATAPPPQPPMDTGFPHSSHAPGHTMQDFTLSLENLKQTVASMQDSLRRSPDPCASPPPQRHTCMHAPPPLATLHACWQLVMPRRSS
jgi:hypothetical protein